MKAPNDNLRFDDVIVGGDWRAACSRVACRLTPNNEFLVCGLEDHVTMRMGVSHQGGVDVE
jgi:hypothetical protein